MPRLIDADKLIELCNIMADKCDGIGKSIWEQFATTVEWSPTVDAEPVRHGHWCVTQAYPHTVYCSECFQRFAQAHWAVWEDGSLPRDYCPHCGAKMDW